MANRPPTLVDLPIEIVGLIAPLLSAQDVCRLMASGSKSLSDKIKDSGSVKSVILRYNYNATKLDWPWFAVHQFANHLTTFIYSRQRVKWTINFDFAFKHLMSLPQTLECLKLSGTLAENCTWKEQPRMVDPEESFGHDFICSVPMSKIDLCFDSNSNSYRNTTPWPVSDEIKSKLQNDFFDFSSRLPRLTFLELNDSDSRSATIISQQVSLFPPTLKALKLKWNQTMEEDCAKLLPRQLTSLILPCNCNFSAYSLTYLPPTLTVLRIPMLSISTIPQAQLLPQGLVELDVSLADAPDVAISILPRTITKLYQISPLTRNVLKALPKSLKCLHCCSGIPQERWLKYCPPSLTHLSLPNGVTPSIFQHLPPNVIALDVERITFGKADSLATLSSTFKKLKIKERTDNSDSLTAVVSIFSKLGIIVKHYSAV